MTWQFFYCGNILFLMKNINNFLMKNKIIFTWILPLFSLSFILLNKSHMFLYLNDIHIWIEHLYILWNMWKFISWRETGKWSIFFDGAFIPGHSVKQFNMHSHLGICFILKLYKDDYVTTRNSRLWFVCVDFLEIFQSLICRNIS